MKLTIHFLSYIKEMSLKAQRRSSFVSEFAIQCISSALPNCILYQQLSHKTVT